MSLRRALQIILENYEVETNNPITNNWLANYLRKDAAEAVGESLHDHNTALKVTGSPGQGVWAGVPWIACFYSVITESATSGFYVVYLFNSKAKTVTLSLNQGTTAVRAEYGTKKSFDVLRDNAALIRHRLNDLIEGFDSSAINFGLSKPLPRGYEAGHAFGYTYNLVDLPSENTLVDDLNRICKAYLKLAYRGGLAPSNNINGTTEDDEALEKSLSVDETKRYRNHRRIERNPKAAKLAKKGRPAICEACSFQFSATYGELGEGYIEAHHLRPLSSLNEGESVLYNASDFALLCANCHRMIHRLDDPSNITKLKKIIGSHS